MNLPGDNPYRSPEIGGRGSQASPSTLANGCAALLTLFAWCLLGFGFGGLINLSLAMLAGPFDLDQVGQLGIALWLSGPWIGMAFGAMLGAFRIRRWWRRRQFLDRHRAELEQLVAQHRPPATPSLDDTAANPFSDREPTSH